MALGICVVAEVGLVGIVPYEEVGCTCFPACIRVCFATYVSVRDMFSRIGFILLMCVFFVVASLWIARGITRVNSD